MRRRNHLKVDTFPFLAVLLCAMGSLILVLLIMDRRSKLAARNRGIAEARKIAEEYREAEVKRRLAHDKKRQEQQLEWDQKKQKLAESVTAEDARLDGQLREIQEKLARTASQLRDEENEIERLNSQLAREKRRASEEEKSLDAAQADSQKISRKLSGAEEARRQLALQLETLEKLFQELKDARKQDGKTFSVVPYRGKNGDNRWPLYMECTAEGFIFHPDRLKWSPDSPVTLLREEVQRRVQEQAREMKLAGVKKQRPYLLLLVRPAGVKHYYELQASLRDIDLDFGYEFVDPDWKLEIPDSTRVLAGLTPDRRPEGEPTARGIPRSSQPGAMGSSGGSLGEGGVGSGTGNAAGTGSGPGSGKGTGTGQGSGMGTGGVPGNGTGTGSGSGTGAGSGTASGTGTSQGTGIGSGMGTGSVMGSGPGTGTGTGSGTGTGTSRGTGIGSGMGTGSVMGAGPGTGTGSGSGTGVGTGTGSGTGSGTGNGLAGGTGNGTGTGGLVGTGNGSTAGTGNGLGSGPGGTGGGPGLPGLPSTSPGLGNSLAGGSVPGTGLNSTGTPGGNGSIGNGPQLGGMGEKTGMLGNGSPGQPSGAGPTLGGDGPPGIGATGIPGNGATAQGGPGGTPGLVSQGTSLPGLPGSGGTPNPSGSAGSGGASASGQPNGTVGTGGSTTGPDLGSNPALPPGSGSNMAGGGSVPSPIAALHRPLPFGSSPGNSPGSGDGTGKESSGAVGASSGVGSGTPGASPGNSRPGERTPSVDGNFAPLISPPPGSGRGTPGTPAGTGTSGGISGAANDAGSSPADAGDSENQRRIIPGVPNQDTPSIQPPPLLPSIVPPSSGEQGEPGVAPHAAARIKGMVGKGGTRPAADPPPKDRANLGNPGAPVGDDKKNPDEEEAPRRPRMLRPARIHNQGEVTIFVECRRDQVVVYPGEKVMDAETIRQSPPQNPLYLAVYQEIMRRQAVVPRGEKGPRYVIRFLLHRDGEATFHRAYPALETLPVTKSRYNLMPDDDVQRIVLSD